jgi:hypothetical protein
MVDLVEQIREEWAGFIYDEHTYAEIDKYNLAMKAADEIEKLRNSIEQLRKQLNDAIKDQAKAYTEGYSEGRQDCVDESFTWNHSTSSAGVQLPISVSIEFV